MRAEAGPGVMLVFNLFIIERVLLSPANLEILAESEEGGDRRKAQMVSSERETWATANVAY